MKKFELKKISTSNMQSVVGAGYRCYAMRNPSAQVGAQSRVKGDQTSYIYDCSFKYYDGTAWICCRGV